MATTRGKGEALAHLQEEGYVVIKDVLSVAECTDALEKLWQELEMAPGVSRHDPSTWGDNSTFGNNWGHSDFLWFVRGLPNVRKVWEMIHRTDDLLVSFDGASLYRPWGINPEWCAVPISASLGPSFRAAHRLRSRDRPRRNAPAMGLHTDRRNHEGIPDGYVQGLVNLITTSAVSGGNVVIPKSHKYVDDLDEVRSKMKEGQSFYECASAL